MEKRRLGQSSLQIAPLAFGGNVFGWTADESDLLRPAGCLRRRRLQLHRHRGRVFALASRQQGGESETIIGKWLKARGNRDKVIIATKLGIEMGPGKKGLSRAYMMQAVEASLRRLQTDYIDLYQSHRDDPDTPIEETLSGYADLIKQGKVREIGASNFTAARLAESLRISTDAGPAALPKPAAAIQPGGTPGIRGRLEDLCLKEKIGVIPFYSLASGFLTGKYRSAADAEGRARGSRVEKYLNDAGLRVLEALDDVAERYQREAGAGRAGLDDRAAEHHRADRQRDERRSVARDHAGAGDQAGQRRHRADRQGECA